MFRLVTRARIIAGILAVGVAATTFTGCYGSFGLTKKVYQFNGGVGNKWLKSILFVAMNIVPVYGVSTFADAVIFNLIEFWTGSNPIASKDGGRFDQKLADGTRVQGQKLSDGRLEVTLTPVDGEAKVVVLDREADGVKATTLDGAFLAKVASAADGRTLLITPKAN